MALTIFLPRDALYQCNPVCLCLSVTFVISD